METTIRETPILMYHSISDSTGPDFQDFTVPPALFHEQMGYLYSNGFATLTVTEFATAIVEHQPLPERRVVLTFDDGFVDFYTNALPVLQQFRCRATLYIPTAYVGMSSRWMDLIGEGNRPILDWDTLRKLPSSIECGAHSHTHPQLDILSLPAVQEEILLSKHLLESRLQRPILTFCYPHGFSTRSVRRLVKEAGFIAACAGLMPTDDIFALPRLFVTPDMLAEHFAQLLTKRPSLAERRIRPFASAAFRLVRRTHARFE